MKRAGIVIGIIAILVGVLVLATPSDKKQSTGQTTDGITLQDAHGLAVDRKDSSKLYIATHSGLLAMTNDAKLQRVSDAEDDYMGFSAHPTDANILYSSGHPSSGGNIGFQRSTDGGKTWQKIAEGVGGPVDFHTMAVSHADPSVLYGLYRGQLQRSNNEGKSWELVETDIPSVITLATDSTLKEVVYAGTSEGLYASQNNGTEWSKVQTVNGAVTAISTYPVNGNNIVIFADGQGLMKSTDGLKTWTRLPNYSGSIVMHLTSDPQNPSTMYLINRALEIHKTTDAGETWNKVR